MELEEGAAPSGIDPASMPAAVLELDLDGVVRAAAGTLLTVPAEVLVGQSLWALVEDAGGTERLTRALAGESVSGAAHWGGRVWQARYNPLHSDGRLVAVSAVFADVTELTQRSPSANDVETTLLAAGEAILVLGPDGHVTWSNAGCPALFGEAVAPGSTLHSLTDSALARHLLERYARLDDAPRTDRHEVQLPGPDGGTVWLLVSARRLDARTLVAVLTDITETKAEQRRLEAVALTDLLTGAASRLAFQDRLTHALQRRTTVLGLMFLDVDGLKVVNDRLGHAAGDALLREIARRAHGVLRPHDTLARYGGDEFVVVCEGLGSPEELEVLAHRVTAAVAAPWDVAGEQVLPSVSVGGATSPPHSTADQLLAAADAASYTAKRAAPGSVRMAWQLPGSDR